MARILLVEDEDLIRRSLAHLLRRSGHEVREAGSGYEALDTASTFHPDLLITDWMLKNHSHGLDVARRLAEDNPGLLTIVITGFPSQRLRAEAEGAPGVVAFLEKPFRFEELAAAVARALAPPA
jgi:two-component system nitrogen regulation response regulator GlnG